MSRPTNPIERPTKAHKIMKVATESKKGGSGRPFPYFPVISEVYRIATQTAAAMAMRSKTD